MQVGARHVAHDEVELAVGLARPVDRHDVRMIDQRGEPRLALEALAERRIGGAIGGDQLERDGPPEVELDRPVDDAHAAATRDRFDAEITEDVTRSERWSRLSFWRGPIQAAHIFAAEANARGRSPPTLLSVSTQARPAPLSYLGGRTFVDDHALLLRAVHRRPDRRARARKRSRCTSAPPRSASARARARHAATRELEELVAGLGARRRPGADALALALVPARQPRRGQRARAAAAPARARARRRAARRLAARRDPAPRRARHDRRRAARDARRAPSCGSS